MSEDNKNWEEACARYDEHLKEAGVDEVNRGLATLYHAKALKEGATIHIPEAGGMPSFVPAEIEPLIEDFEPILVTPENIAAAAQIAEMEQQQALNAKMGEDHHEAPTEPPPPPEAVPNLQPEGYGDIFQAAHQVTEAARITAKNYGFDAFAVTYDQGSGAYQFRCSTNLNVTYVIGFLERIMRNLHQTAHEQTPGANGLPYAMSIKATGNTPPQQST